MKFYYDKIALLIKDHSFFMAALALTLSLIGGAYGIGLKLGDNRKVFLEDKITSLQEKIVDIGEKSEEIDAEREEYSLKVAELQEEIRGYIGTERSLQIELSEFTATREKRDTTLEQKDKEIAELWETQKRMGVRIQALLNLTDRLRNQIAKESSSVNAATTGK